MRYGGVNMAFAERLKALREDNDEKQKDIAELLNVSSSMISFYESGLHFPRDEKLLLKLVKHFGVSMDYLMGLTDIPNYRQLDNILGDISSLSKNGIDELQNYIQFLKFKEKSDKKRKNTK